MFLELHHCITSHNGLLWWDSVYHRDSLSCILSKHWNSYWAFLEFILISEFETGCKVCHMTLTHISSPCMSCTIWMCVIWTSPRKEDICKDLSFWLLNEPSLKSKITRFLGEFSSQRRCFYLGRDGTCPFGLLQVLIYLHGCFPSFWILKNRLKFLRNIKRDKMAVHTYVFEKVIYNFPLPDDIS